jgi:anti-anti-sigma regulatory factor
MEHRHGSRIDLGLGVDVALENRSLGHFQTRNIGRGGVFLETGSIDLRPNVALRLELLLNGRRRCLSAVVAHRSAGGIGVMLTADDPDYARFCRDALDGHPVAPVPAVEDPAELVPSGGHGPAVAGDGAGRCALQWVKDSATLVLRLGERFDISDYTVVAQAVESIRILPTQQVVVDFGATREVFDSGMALLLLLREGAESVANPIALVNCTPAVRGRLTRAGIAHQFRIGRAISARMHRKTRDRSSFRPTAQAGP